MIAINMMKSLGGPDILRELVSSKPLEAITPYKACLVELTRNFVDFIRWADCEPCVKSRVSRIAATHLLKLVCSQTPLTFGQMTAHVIHHFPPDFCTSFFDEVKKDAGDFNSYLSSLTNCKLLVCDLLDRDNRPVVEKNSILGHFIRRMWLAAENCSITEFKINWEQFQAYTRQENVTLLPDHSAENDNAISVDQNANAQRDKISASKICSRHPFNASCSSVALQNAGSSRREFMAFVNEQIFFLLVNPRLAASYDVIEHRLLNARQKFPYSTKWLYLRYLNAERVGDFIGAKDALHEYFDWGAADPCLQKYAITASSMWNNRSLRYGPFCLAKLNRQFGYRQQAISHIQESITKAQEANDVECLQFAMAEYMSILREVDTREFLKTCVIPSEDTNESASFKVVLCKILGEVQTGNAGKQWTGTLNDMQQNHRQSNNMLISSLLSSIYLSNGCLTQASQEAKQSCLCVSTARSSNVENREDLVSLILIQEAQCSALCNLAFCCIMQGKIAEANNYINHAKNSHVGRSQYRKVLLAEGWIQFMDCLYGAKFDSCDNWCLQISSCSQSDGILCRFLLNMVLGDDINIAQLKKHAGLATDHYTRCRFLICLSDYYALVEKNLGLASFYLKECQYLCEIGQLRLVLGVVLRRLAHIKVQVGALKTALNYVDKAEKLLRVCGDLIELGKLFLLKSDCLSCMLDKADTDITKQRLVAKYWLTEASSIFEICHTPLLQKEACIRLAHFYHEQKDLAERKIWTKRFNKLDDDYPGSFRVLLL